MSGCMRHFLWVGPLAAGFAFAAVFTLQATITIGDAFIHATRLKPIASQEPGLDAPRTFEERWASSTDWHGLRTADSTRE
jgi:hypothetical protein